MPNFTPEDYILLQQSPDTPFMRGLPHDGIGETEDGLGFDWGGMFSKIGGAFKSGASKIGTGFRTIGTKIGSNLGTGIKATGAMIKTAAPALIPIASQAYQAKLQNDIIKAQNATDAAYAAQAQAAQTAAMAMPTGSNGSVASMFSASSPNSPYSQPTSESFLTKQVAGIPVWAIGAGAIGLVAVIAILKKK